MTTANFGVLALLLLTTINNLVVCLDTLDELPPSDTTTTATLTELHTESQAYSYDHEHQYHHHHHNPPGRAPGSNETTNGDGKKSIDWRQVEADFERVLADDEVLHRWDAMEGNMKSGMRALLRSIFPKVVAMSTDAKVSGNCSAGILKWIVSLRNMKTWAMKMFDAIGKPTSGMFEGVVTMFGNYDQCLAIRVYEDDQESDSALEGDANFFSTEEDAPKPPDTTKEFFRGQYCVAEFKPWLPAKPRFYGMNSHLKTSLRSDDSVFAEFSKMAVFFHFLSFRIDLCVPSTCTRDDIQKVTMLMANLAEFRSRVIRCESAPQDSSLPFNLLVFVLVLLLLILIMGLATLKDTCTFQLVWLHARLTHVFSIVRTWSHLREMERVKRSKLQALAGARVLVIIWIIAAHTFIQVDYQYLREMQTLKNLASRWVAQIFTNSLFQFDVLLLISAFAFGYYNIDNTREKVLRYFLKRYLKISVLVAFLMLVVAALPTILPSGPLVNDFVAKQAEACGQRWWVNLLYLQNYFPSECLPATWIFGVELQLSLLTLPLLVFYYAYSDRKSGRLIFWLVLPALMLIGFGYNFIRVFRDRLPPTFYWTLPDREQRTEYFQGYYYRPLTHLSVYAVGFYAGVYRKLSNSKKKTIFNEPNILMFGYFLSLFTIVSFTFGFHDWATGELPNEYISALYAGGHSLSLALAFAWIFFSVTDDTRESRKSIFTRLLGAELFCQLGKLTLTSFLVLPLVQTIFLATQQQHLFSSWLLMFYVIIGNVLLTYLLATFLALFIEIPTTIVLRSWLKFLFTRWCQRLGPAHDAENTSFDSKLRENSSTNLCPANIEIPSYTFRN